MRVLGPRQPRGLRRPQPARVLAIQGGRDHERRRRELARLVELSTRIHGAEHLETFELRGALAAARVDLVGHAQSAQEMREVLDDMRRALGPTRRDVSVLRLNLAVRLHLADELSAAAEALTELLAERVRSHGPYHRDTIATRHCLSKVLTDQQDYAGAAAELAEVIEGLQLAHRCGEANRAHEALSHALALAEPWQALRAFRTAGQPIRALLAQRTGRFGRLDSFATQVLAALPASAPGPTEALTKREQALLAELPSMRTAEEIANTMFVSVNTVKSHMRGIYRKLGVNHRRDAITVARQRGLL